MGYFKDCQERLRAYETSPVSLSELLTLRKRIYAQESTRKSHLVRGVEELIRVAKAQVAEKEEVVVENKQNRYWLIAGVTAGALLVTTYISSYALWVNDLLAKNEPCVCLCA